MTRKEFIDKFFALCKDAQEEITPNVIAEILDKAASCYYFVNPVWVQLSCTGTLYRNNYRLPQDNFL